MVSRAGAGSFSYLPLTKRLPAAHVSRPRRAESLKDWSPRPPTSVTSPTTSAFWGVGASPGVPGAGGESFLQAAKARHAAAARVKAWRMGLIKPGESSGSRWIASAVTRGGEGRGGVVGGP